MLPSTKLHYSSKQLVFFLAVIFIIKYALSMQIFITGDEAYFFLWSQNLSINYYDHPPMIGWVLFLFASISKSLASIRFLAILTPLLIAFTCFSCFKSYSREKSFLIALLIALSPFNLLNLIITNDTSLLLFSFLSVMVFLYSLEKTSFMAAIIAGLLFGLAFLSKYLSVVFAFGLFAAVFFVSYRKKYVLLFTAALATTPFILFNLYANYQNCWTNIIFNFNRVGHSGINVPASLFSLFASFAYLLTPTFIFFLLKSGRKIKELPDVFKFCFIAALAMTGFFSILAFKKLIGLHWILFIIPLYFIAAIALFSLEQIRKTCTHALWIAAVHILALGILLAAPHQLLDSTRAYKTNSQYLSPHEVAAIVSTKSDRYILTTATYSFSSFLHYYTGEHFGVFGRGSNYGREDDKISNFAEYDGKPIAIVAQASKKLEQYEAYFEHSTIEIFPIKSGEIKILLGENFNFEKYKEDFLSLAFSLYYEKPDFLPSGQCYWKKYGFEQ